MAEVYPLHLDTTVDDDQLREWSQNHVVSSLWFVTTYVARDNRWAHSHSILPVLWLQPLRWAFINPTIPTSTWCYQNLSEVKALWISSTGLSTHPCLWGRNTMAETPSSTACQANASCRKLHSTARRCDQGGNIQRPLASNSGQVWTKVGGFIFIGFMIHWIGWRENVHRKPIISIDLLRKTIV